MGKENKKWYQTGEFENGYQFGDVFRTIKNTLSANSKKKNTNQRKTTEENNEDFNNVKASLSKIERGRLSANAAARLFGFADEVERKDYIKQNPHLYAVMGGHKYELDESSKNYVLLNDEWKKIVQGAMERDAYINSLQYKMDREDNLRAEIKRLNGQNLTDREVEAEQRFRWLNENITNEELLKNTEKAKAVNNAITEFNNGEEISLSERFLLAENGGENFTNGNTNKIIDFLANDNPENISARNNFEKAVEKEKSGEMLTDKERADISNYIAREQIKKSIVKDKYTLSEDIKANAENLNTIAATGLYNDAVYKKGMEKTLAQMELYTSTGMTKYLQDTINTGTVFLTERAYAYGLSDERASDALEDIPQNKFEIANNAVGEYFTKNDKKFSKFVQDTTVSLSYNAIPMMLGSVSGGVSMAATGLSIFGGSYAEAAKLAPDAEEWRYWLYAGINTASELYMEKALSGDKNIFANSSSDFSESMFKDLTKNISNKTLLKGAYILSNSTGETFEENIQGLLSPVLQKMILGADVVSILSTSQSEQRQAMSNALYDGFVGFASAGVTTGILGNDAINSIEQKRTVGSYYKKVFNDLKVDVNDVAVYLKEISGGRNTDLYNSAQAVLNGDTTDSAVADMMLIGFDQSREAQRFVYTKIGKQLNENNRYTADRLIKQYEKLSSSGIGFSKSIKDTYDSLINADENTSKGTFNYLVGKLSATMDAVIPRASVEAEVIKKIGNDIEENGLPRGLYPSIADAVPLPLGKGGLTHKDSIKIDENAFVDGLWDDSPNSSKDNVEKSQLESVENVRENGIIEEKLDNDNGVPGEYKYEIIWQGRKIPARRDGEGYRGSRTKQHDKRVDAYELKLNPDNESYFLYHPDGKTVQFENMKNGIVQDCKLVMDKMSIYYVKEKIPVLNIKILKQARRQMEAANFVGYKVEWLMSEQKAVDQMRQLFNENNLDIIVTYYPE